MKNTRLISFFKIILLSLVLLLTLFRATSFFGLRGVLCDSNWLTIESPCQWTNVFLEIALWIIAIALIIILFMLEHNFVSFYKICTQNWLIFVFILLAFISILWSVQSEISIYKSFILFFTTLVAIYIASTYNLHKILNLYVLYYVFLCAVNLLFIITLFPWGIMNSSYANGAWKGVFWNRTYLGCLMVPGVVLFLVKILERKRYSKNENYLNIFIFVITCTLLVKSGSVTAILTTLVILVIFFILLLWKRLNQVLKPIHYYSFSFIVIIAIMIFLANLDPFLSIFERNSTLTRRVPMWDFVYQNLIIKRLWLGYGYGVIWHLKGITNELAIILHWPNPVLIGDSGYIDIFLHLGIFGLIILLSLIFLSFIRGIKYTLKEQTLESSVPFLILVAVVISNITLSLILESEAFIWMMTVALIISITPNVTITSEEIH